VEKMKPDTFPSKELIFSISSMKSFCRFLTPKDETYQKVLDQVLQYDYYNEDSKLPSSKDIYTKLGITSASFKKYLNQIYTDLIELMFNNPSVFSISKLTYHFYIRGFPRSEGVSINGYIPFCPRVGDQVELPFLRAHFHSTYFYVEKMNHELTDTKQIISIWLKYGSYNQYQAFKKDQDLAEGKISLHEYYE